MGESYDYLFKLLLLGDSGVGKSSLLARFGDNLFTSTFIATVGVDYKIKTIELDGRKIKLQIWDTAGQERFRTITDSYYRGAMGVMIVYDVTDEYSFQHVPTWIRDLDVLASPGVQKFLLGNKIDSTNERRVTKDEGQALALQYGCSFMETSAKSSENVEEAFRNLSRDILAALVKKEEESRSVDNPVLHNQHEVVRLSVPKKDKRSKFSRFLQCKI